jgi:hypothetical protein
VSYPLALYNQINERPTIAYARVSSHDQKEDLERQVQMLELYCAARGWTYLLLTDFKVGNELPKARVKAFVGTNYECLNRSFGSHTQGPITSFWRRACFFEYSKKTSGGSFQKHLRGITGDLPLLQVNFPYKAGIRQ